MDDSLSNAVDAYISCDGGVVAEGGTPPVAAAALEEVCREVPSRVPLPQLVQEMGEYLTHEDGAIRRRATALLAIILERASPVLFAPGSSTHHVLLTFFIERLDDYPSVVPCMRAIRALLAIAAAAPAGSSAATLMACKGLFSKLQVQAMEQGTRQQLYELLEYVLVTPAHSAALAEKPPLSASSDSPYALDFAVGFVNAMDGEKDPRCLLVALRIARVLLTSAAAPATPGARSPVGGPPRIVTHGFGDLVASFTGELFDVTACYFPITFTPPPNDPYGISKEALVSTLRGVFAASPRMAPFVMPLLLEKLASPSADVKRDILQTMQGCLPRFGIPALREQLTEIASALQQEVLSGREVPASSGGTGGDAFEPAGRLLASLWTGSSSTTSVGLSAGSIGLNFSGATDVHTNTGYGLYVAKSATSTGGPGGPSGNDVPSITDEALVTLAATTRLLSRHVQSTGSHDEWHAFVSPLVRAALSEVSRAAESMVGRASARILCALASSSHHALSSVLEVAMPVISAVYDDATAHHRLAVRSSVLALLAGLLHTVDHGIDHAAGHHPLSKHLSRIYDILLETLENPLLPPMPTSAGVSTVTQALLAAASEARCIAAAGLCDIAVRPPSAVLAVEQKFQITSQFTTIFLTDADDLVREACLRALCTMASVRQRFCSAVLVAAVPRLLAVLREAFSEPSSPVGLLDGHAVAGSSAEDAASMLTAPTITSAEWYSSMHAPGVSDDVSRALYALGQLCCISNMRVHHVVVPQLLELAVEQQAARGDASPSRRAALALRGTFTADGPRGPTVRAIAVAIIDTLGRMVSTKATVSDVAAMDALLVNSPDALATYAELIHNTGGTTQLLNDGSEIRTESSRRSIQSEDSSSDVKPATTHSNGSHRASILHDHGSVEGAGMLEEGGPDGAAPPGEPMLLIPTLLHLILDHARGYTAADVEARLASMSLTPGPVVATFTPSAPAVRPPLPARVRTSIELIFRVAAIRASASVQDAFRETVSRLLLCIPPGKTGSPSTAAAGSVDASAVVLPVEHAPWFRPLAHDAPQDMTRHLPALLKVLSCSRRGAPVPYFAELAHALAHVVFELRFPRQRTCEDSRQRHHARLAWALSRTMADPEDVMAPVLVEDAATEVTSDASPVRASAAASATGQLHADMQRTAIIAAQALGVMTNRHPAGGDNRAAFDAVLCTVLQCIVKRSGLGAITFAGALTACAGAPPSSDMPPVGYEAITIARERGVLLLVWLCKGLAMRAHSLAQQCLAALVSVISGHDVAWVATVPLDAHIITLAGQGLGVILADAAPRHPFHKDAGAAAIGLYKQKLFSAVFSQYKSLATALRPQREASVDDSSTIISNASSAAYDGLPASTASPIAISAFVGSRSDLTEASAARLVPLLLSLCAMAAHLPQNVLLSEIDKVLPLVVRALEIITPVDASAVTGGSSSAVRRLQLSAESLGLTSAASFVELRDAVAISALLCLRLLVQHAPSDVAVHLHSLVPVLVALARHSPSHASKPLVRATAIDCLRGFVALPYHRLHPVRATVVQGLYGVLDDPKRAVRRRAAACRNDWMTLSTGAAPASGK